MATFILSNLFMANNSLVWPVVTLVTSKIIHDLVLRDKLLEKVPSVGFLFFTISLYSMFGSRAKKTQSTSRMYHPKTELDHLMK